MDLQSFKDAPRQMDTFPPDNYGVNINQWVISQITTNLWLYHLKRKLHSFPMNCSSRVCMFTPCFLLKFVLFIFCLGYAGLVSHSHKYRLSSFQSFVPKKQELTLPFQYFWSGLYVAVACCTKLAGLTWCFFHCFLPSLFLARRLSSVLFVKTLNTIHRCWRNLRTSGSEIGIDCVDRPLATPR